MKLLYLLILSLFFSCRKDDEKQVCGMETQASFTVHNFNEFVDLNSNPKENDVFYSSSYLGPLPNEPLASNSWSAKVGLAGICNTDVPNIKFSVELNNPKPYLEIRGNVQEDNLYAKTTLIKLTSVDGIHFNGSLDLVFKGELNGSKTVSAYLIFITTSKGSYEADRDYFFSILSSMSCTIKAHKPE